MANECVPFQSRKEQFNGKINAVTKRLKVKSMAGTTLFAHGKFITQETEAQAAPQGETNFIPDIPIAEIIEGVEAEKDNGHGHKVPGIEDGEMEGPLAQEASSESRLPLLQKQYNLNALTGFIKANTEEPKKLYSLDDLRNPADFECAARYLPPSFHNMNSPKALPPSRERACSVMTNSTALNSLGIAGPTSKIVIFGGLGSECFQDMWTNNCISAGTTNPNANSTYTPSWTSVPAEAGSLVARFESTMDLYMSNTLVLFGGKSNKGRSYTVRTNDLFVLTDNLRWNRVAWEEDSPIPRSSHASAIVGDWLIVFGGTNQEDDLLFDGFAVKLLGIEKKNRASMNWLPFKNETSLKGLSHHQMCLVVDPEDTRSILIPFHKMDKLKPRTVRGNVEKALYVFGGINSQTGGCSRELYMIRLFASTFVFRRVETVGKRPKPRVGHTMHYIPRIESLVIMFGRDPTTREYLSSISMISLITMNWYKVKLVQNSLLPVPRAFHCSHVDERSGKVFIFGGVNDDGFLPMAIDSVVLVPILRQGSVLNKGSPTKSSPAKQSQTL